MGFSRRHRGAAWLAAPVPKLAEAVPTPRPDRAVSLEREGVHAVSVGDPRRHLHDFREVLDLNGFKEEGIPCGQFGAQLAELVAPPRPGRTVLAHGEGVAVPGGYGDHAVESLEAKRNGA